MINSGKRNILRNNMTFFEEDLKIFTGLSLSIHFFAVLILLLFQFTLGERNRSEYNLNEISPAVRVDVVEMPNLTMQELKKIQVQRNAVAQPEVKEEVSEESSKIEFKKPVEGKSLSEILKEEAQKKVKMLQDKNEVKKSKEDSNALSNKFKELIIQGNKISKGTSLTGDGREQISGNFGLYVATLPEYVRPNWKLPSYLLNKNLSCRIRIFLDVNGNLVKAEFYQNSGDEEYDKRAMESVKLTKFPAPDETIRAGVLNGRILLGFPL